MNVEGQQCNNYDYFANRKFIGANSRDLLVCLLIKTHQKQMPRWQWQIANACYATNRLALQQQESSDLS